jgi:hypothetical protein
MYLGCCPTTLSGPGFLATAVKISDELRLLISPKREHARLALLELELR